jgi:hypothetical protein
MTIAIGPVGQADFSQLGVDFGNFRNTSAQSLSEASAAPVMPGAFAGVDLPSISSLTTDTDARFAQSLTITDTGDCGCKPDLFSRISHFAKEHRTAAWSAAAVGAFGIATLAGAMAATGGGIVLSALALTAKFGSVIAATQALKDVRDISPVLAWLRPR